MEFHLSVYVSEADSLYRQIIMIAVAITVCTHATRVPYSETHQRPDHRPETSTELFVIVSSRPDLNLFP